ncbi:MAG: phospholipase D-like domain-containing protein [Desulfobacteraceae bacterium]|nr:phospholipase D-like domain-containing protein [Desulfobacteraceae bacterium]
MGWFRNPGKARFSGMAALLLVCLLSSPPAWGLSGQLNVNTATLKELQLLPFIGETRARAILAYRQRHGRFKSLDELLASEAIGGRSFEAIRPYLTLTGPTTLRGEPEAADKPAAVCLRVQTRIMGTYPGEIVLLPDAAYYDTLRQYLRQAERKIEIVMFLFKMNDSPQNRPATLLKELTAAAGRRVDVQVLLERSDHDEELNRENERVARALRAKGVTVTFDSPRTTTHAKLVVIDDRFCFVGSHNLTQAALAYNHEFSLLIDNQKLAGDLSAYIAKLKSGK